ncbi:hypothetical protein GCM10009122_24460 [Fulvivirga kasyanovii]|uniref:PLP-dependent aminotransferase family protein n=1 Tax=Fulvivirga kasyanovii TaxID=396812 RepID=A0ABW9RT35_9BACT|nr:PLP-dependent aminotransferase family protein [Fulvivirga kasyanovii]
MVTSGCLEAINLGLDILTKSGDNILVDPLNYFNIREFLTGRPVNIYTFPFNTPDFDAVAFEKTISEFNITLCLVCPNFHNPTGVSMADHHKKRLVEIAGAKGVHIIEDDVYGDVYFGTRRPSTLKSFDLFGCVLYCSSFSKSLAPGFRVGYCLTESYADKLARAKRLLSLGTSSLSQAALADFMRTGRFDLHLKALRKQLHLNLLKYGDAIIKYFPPTVKFNVPAGGFVLWLRFPASVDGYEFFKEALKYDIVVVPGQIFAQHSTHTNYIRLSYSEPFDELIEQSVKRLGELAYKMIGQG